MKIDCPLEHAHYEGKRAAIHTNKLDFLLIWGYSYRIAIDLAERYHKENLNALQNG